MAERLVGVVMVVRVVMVASVVMVAPVASVASVAFARHARRLVVDKTRSPRRDSRAFVPIRPPAARIVAWQTTTCVRTSYPRRDQRCRARFVVCETPQGLLGGCGPADAPGGRVRPGGRMRQAGGYGRAGGCAPHKRQCPMVRRKRNQRTADALVVPLGWNHRETDALRGRVPDRDPRILWPNAIQFPTRIREQPVEDPRRGREGVDGLGQDVDGDMGPDR